MREDKRLRKTHIGSIIAVLIVGFGGPIDTSAVEGDLELLRLAAAEYESNQGRLRTWTALVSVTAEALGSSGNAIRTRGKLNYTLDRDSGRLRWAYRAEDDADVDVRDSAAAQNEQRFIAGLQLPDEGVTYYLTLTAQDQKPAGRTLLVFDANGIKGLPTTSPFGSFKPLYFYRDGVTDFPKRLLHLRQMAIEGRVVKSTMVITRDGQRVTIERENGALRWKDVVDLAAGGNLVKAVAEEPGRVRTTTWEFQKIEDCFVPLRKAVELREDASKSISKTDEVWLENHVNEKLADDEFNLERLGVKAGDHVHDNRAGIDYTYGDAGDEVAEPPSNLHYGILAFLGVLALLSVLLLVARHRGKLRQ